MCGTVDHQLFACFFVHNEPVRPPLEQEADAARDDPPGIKAVPIAHGWDE